MALPDFFVVGAPKAGTTALHAALARQPGLFLSPVKEPKFFRCDGRPPPLFRGPGDAHRAREWVWRRSDYEALFDGAPPGWLRGESTPLYLADPAAHRRIAAAVPRAKLLVVVRDPVDRAHSNWMHLWSDGLEPIPDFLAAVEAEDARRAAGWAPFWGYTRLGHYGEQLAHLRTIFPAEQVLVLRYRELVDDPVGVLARVSGFLGVELHAAVAASGATPENVRPYVPPSLRTTLIARAVRTGAALGAYAAPAVWRRASRPLLAALHADGAPRPVLSVAERRTVLARVADDVPLLEEVTGQSFRDWLGDAGRGEFRARTGAAGEVSPQAGPAAS